MLNLCIENLELTVAERTLLTGVTFKVAAGERLAIQGPSGSGKSTLLRAIAGLLPHPGRVTLNGRSPEQLGWPAFRRQVVLVSQTAAFGTMTLQQALRRPFSFGTATHGFPEQRATELLDRVGLGQLKPDTPAARLSGGEQQRLALVRALLVSPAVLLLDEPTSALDEDNRDAVEAALTEQKASLLLISHDRASAERLCGRRIDLTRWAP